MSAYPGYQPQQFPSLEHKPRVFTASAQMPAAARRAEAGKLLLALAAPLVDKLRRCQRRLYSQRRAATTALPVVQRRRGSSLWGEKYQCAKMPNTSALAGSETLTACPGLSLLVAICRSPVLGAFPVLATGWHSQRSREACRHQRSLFLDFKAGQEFNPALEEGRFCYAVPLAGLAVKLSHKYRGTRKLWSAG